MGVGAVGANPEAVEEGFADQMRRVALHRADPDIDARLAEIDRPELRMRIRHVQDARIAEALEIVDAGRLGAARETRQGAGKAGGTRNFQKIPAADGHAVSPRLVNNGQRISMSFQRSFSLVA